MKASRKHAYELTQAYLLFPFEAFACNCCGLVIALPRLVLGYYHLCQYVPAKDVILHSGCRCELHNFEVGGSKTSWHPLGGAIDYHIIGLTLLEMFQIAKMVPEFQGHGAYKQWKHPGMHSDIRENCTEWEQVDGVYRKGITWTN